MSSSSTDSRRPSHNRLESLRSEGRSHSRNTSRVRPKAISYDDTYTYALRVAYLHHLLSPRAKRKQYVPAPKISRSSTAASIGDLMKEFSKIKDTKSAKFPHGFMGPLEKRLQGVLMGSEKLPGFNDASLKRTFAEAYTAFAEPGFRRRMDKERRVEDLVLIFYSNATKSLQKGKAPDDDSWKIMVDRHVALFVRLLSNTLKDSGEKDRPELMSRLATLENKLLTNDQDLTTTAGQKDGATIEVITPLSYDVKDMLMVQTVARIFGLTNSQVQTDLDENKGVWTEQAALVDLKSYQHHLEAGEGGTLTSDDFDLDEAYQDWKKHETPDLSQMILDILHVRPDLTKSSGGGVGGGGGMDKDFPPISPVTSASDDSRFSGLVKTLSSPIASRKSIIWDQPPDVSALSLQEEPTRSELEDGSYTFIPSEPRAFYRSILMHAMTFDQLHSNQDSDGPVVTAPLSRASLELLTELCVRWRIPQFSRLVLFLDVAAQKFVDQEISLEELDNSFEFIKNPPAETRRAGTHTHSVGLESYEQSQWTLQDFALYRATLSNLHDTLLRELYELMQHCYEAKPPSVGYVMGILENHIVNDPTFSKSEEELDEFTATLTEGLVKKSATVYRGFLEKEIPQSQEEWNFYHVVQLGKSVVKVCERIQKRYRKNPDIMGANPLTILVETMFPSFEHDANEIIQRIMHVAYSKNSEVDLEDGFDLYRELVEIRRIHQDALPSIPFAFHIEGLLADFVWRWIRVTDFKMLELVDQAIVQDQFQVRGDQPEGYSTDDERHSVSVIDIFRLFNQTADQIFQLHWDDDVQYAKFMTALAKSYGIGLARYCEVIEQRFAKEMDRLSPAQEAAALQTKQEKWMQLAKDAWNNKDKIEPFQFYPEVCSIIIFNGILLTCYSLL